MPKNPETHSQQDLDNAIEATGVIVTSAWKDPSQRKDDSPARKIIRFDTEDARYNFVFAAHSENESPMYIRGPKPSRDPSATRGGHKAEIQVNYPQPGCELALVLDSRHGNQEDRHLQLEAMLARNLLAIADVQVEAPNNQ